MEKYVELDLAFSYEVAIAAVKANPLISSIGFLLAHPTDNHIFKQKLNMLHSCLVHYLHKNKTSPWHFISSATFENGTIL